MKKSLLEQQAINQLVNQSSGAGKGQLNGTQAPETNMPGGISIPISQLPDAVEGDTITFTVVSVTDKDVNLQKADIAPATTEVPAETAPVVPEMPGV